MSYIAQRQRFPQHTSAVQTGPATGMTANCAQGLLRLNWLHQVDASRRNEAKGHSRCLQLPLTKHKKERRARLQCVLQSSKYAARPTDVVQFTSCFCELATGKAKRNSAKAGTLSYSWQTRVKSEAVVCCSQLAQHSQHVEAFGDSGVRQHTKKRMSICRKHRQYCVHAQTSD